MEQIITETGMRDQIVGTIAGQQLIQLPIHAIDITADGTLNVVLLPIYGRILIDALLLMEEAIGGFKRWFRDHTDLLFACKDKQKRGEQQEGEKKIEKKELTIGTNSKKMTIFAPVLYNRTRVMAKQQSGTRERLKSRLQEPNMYKVIMHNDDFTTMEFVVEVLKTVFFKQEAEAEQLMLQVHRAGSAVVGLYTYDIAISKVQKAMRMAREKGYPFKLTCEKD